MRTISLSVILCLFATLIFSQDDTTDIPIDLKMSEVFKDKRKFTALAFSTKDNDDGVYIGRIHRKGYYIEHYDNEVNLLSSKEFELKYKDGSIEAAFMSDGNLCLIESLYNKSSKALEFYTNVSEGQSLNFNRKLLFKVPLKDVKKRFSWGFRNKNVDNDVSGDFKVSPTQKYITFTIDIRNKDSETHKLYVFNNNLEKVYETLFKRKIKDKKFILENIDIDEADGSVYLLGKAYVRSKKKKKKGGKYQFELYKLNNSLKEKLIIDAGKKYIGSMTTVVNDGKLFCVGFYSEQNDHRYKGLCYVDIDSKTMEPIKMEYSPFTDQFVMDKYGKSKDKELKNVRFRKIHITEENECIITAEEFFVRSHYVTTGNGGGYWRYTYHFMDLVVAMMSESGNLLWARNINKKQKSDHNSPYLSFTSTYQDRMTYIFMNCSDKIKKLRTDRIQFKGTNAKRSNLYVITLDPEGSFNYEKLLDDKDSEVPFAVGQGLLTKNGSELIFQGRKGSKKQVMKISL